MARHRSPRGRRAHRTPSLPLAGNTGAHGARRGPLAPPVDLCVAALAAAVHAAQAPAVQAARATAVQAARSTAVHAAQLAAVRVTVPSTVPDRVLRGVALATVAAVGASGAGVALAGTAAQVPDAGAARLALPDGAAVVPAPALLAAAGPAALTLPAPDVRGTGATRGATVPAPVLAPPVLDPPVLDPPVLDPPVLDPAGLRRAVARAQADARRLATPDRPDEQDADDQDVDEQDEADARSADRDDPRAEDERTADRARRAGNAADPDASTSECDLGTGGLGAVKPHVRAAATFLGCAFGSPTVLGVAGRSHASDHPRGLALDFMVDRPTGDALAACAIRNREALGVSYVIWRQRIDTGDGFRAMPDRGGATANHFDHVHVSFEPRTGSGDPAAC